MLDIIIISRMHMKTKLDGTSHSLGGYDKKMDDNKHWQGCGGSYVLDSGLLRI